MENTNYFKRYIGKKISIKFLEKVPRVSFEKVTLVKLTKDFLAFEETNGTYHEAIGFNVIIYPASDHFLDKFHKKVNVYLDDYIVYRNCYHLATTNGIVDIITEEGIHMLICADKILIESIS